MNIHKNARLTPLRREEMARDVVEGRLSKVDAARTYGVTAKVVGALGGALSGRGKRRHDRPFLAAEDKPEANRSRGGGRDRSAAPAAPDRQAHRHANRRVRGDGEPGAGTRRPVAAERPGTGRAGAPL